MVIFEAARAICNLKDVTARELTPAITVLQLFLSSSKPVLRFAAVRTLNKVRVAAAGVCCELGMWLWGGCQSEVQADAAQPVS
jgi:hypothetical protein